MGNNVILARYEDESKNGNFNELLNNFEVAYAKGDCGTELMELSKAITYSVLNKVLDPTRSTADKPRENGKERQRRENGMYITSNNGNNPALLAVKHGVTHDICTLEETAYAVENATRLEYDRDECTWKRVVNNRDVAKGEHKIMSSTLTDGIDIVNETAMIILSVAEQYAGEMNWLTGEITVRRLDRRVKIRLDDSAAYKDEESTPLQEIYRHLRQYVRGMQSVHIDPSRQLYVDGGDDPETLERIYYRVGKAVSMASDTENGASISEYIAQECMDIIGRLNLTDRQATVLRLRMEGNGYKSIAKYLGVSVDTVKKSIMRGIRAKAEKIGLEPSLWREMVNERFEADPAERKYKYMPYADGHIDTPTVNHWEEMEDIHKKQIAVDALCSMCHRYGIECPITMENTLDEIKALYNAIRENFHD